MGYGDINPSWQFSKVVVIMFIVTSVTIIPIEINKLVALLSLMSEYRGEFIPRSFTDRHIILCGHVSDWRRLSRFFREFLHPDRDEYHRCEVVILSPLEPSDHMKALFRMPLFDGHVTYLIGSALSVDDLHRARADIAVSMIFFCNLEADTKRLVL